LLPAFSNRSFIWSFDVRTYAIIKHKMKKLAIATSLVLSLIVGSAAVIAQPADGNPPADQGLNIEISPARLLLEGAPGKKIDATLKVRNRNAGVETLKLEILQVKVNQDQIQLVTPDQNDEFVSWVTFGKNLPFEAPFDQIITVPITIDIPKTAAFAYDYAIVISKAEAPTPQPGTTQAVEGKVAQFVLLDVNAPGARRAAEITNFASTRSLYSFLPVVFGLTARNSGNLHVTPVGNIFIRDMSGRQVGTLKVNSENGTILPGLSRSFDSQWNQGFPHYETIDGNRRLVWNWQDISSIRLVKYSAEAVLIYNDGTRDVPITATTSFWVIPWLLLLLVLLVIVLLVAGLYQGIKGFWRLLHRGRNKNSKRRK
jgi:hypothetical protein